MYINNRVLAQKIVEEKNEWDRERSFKFSSIGFFWVGPWVRFALNAITGITSRWYLKIVLDQTLLMPVNMCVVNLVNPLLFNHSLDEAFAIFKVTFEIGLKRLWTSN